jgi:CBS domain-containing protein
MSVAKYCDREIATITRDASIHKAALMMRHYHGGEVIIVEKSNDKNIPIGIVTDRDLVVEIIAMEVDMEQISVGNVMSLELITVSENMSLSDTLDIMQHNGVRRAPVVDGSGCLIGLITVEGILKVLSQDMNKVLELFYRERYIEKTIRS